MIRSQHLLVLACSLVGILLWPSLAGATELPPPAQASPVERPEEPSAEVLVEAPEPLYVAPTLRDRIGRIWAPVLINGKGPFRLVLDTGASHSAIIARVADRLGIDARASETVLLRGFTGSAVVHKIHVERMEVGELLTLSTDLLLGREALFDKRILADFGRDRLIISRSHQERARPGFTTVPLKLILGGLLATDVRVGPIHARAIIDTGAQRTIGNLALRDALMRHRDRKLTTEDIIGVTLDMQRGENVATPPIAFGTLLIRGGSVTFGDMYLFEHWKLTREPTLMIGMDVLGLLDVLIVDYRMRELQIRTRA